MHKVYSPRGVCASRIEFDLDGGVVSSVRILGGCDGNHKGISALCEGMKGDELVARLSGVRCGMRQTSCPDQLACAVREALAEENK